MAPIKTLIALLPLLPALVSAVVQYDVDVVTVEAPAVTITVDGGQAPSTPAPVAPVVHKGLKHKHKRPAANIQKAAAQPAQPAQPAQSGSQPSTSNSGSSDTGANAQADNTAEGYSDDKKFHDTMLATHNALRAQHGASALSHNDSLAEIASNWAKGCNFEHSGGPTGENLASGATPGPAAAIKMWSDEGSQYSGGDFSEATGHYTQMVWKDTTSVGCGRVQCNSGSCPGWFVVCEYFPHGNVIGQFPQNVS